MSPPIPAPPLELEPPPLEPDSKPPFYMHSNLNPENRTTSKISLMPARENIQVTVNLPLHSTVEPSAADPARETAPKIPGFKPPNVSSTRETAPKVSKFKPPTVPPNLVTSLAAFEGAFLVSLFLHRLPELEALQYKQATLLKNSMSQLTDQVPLATEDPVVVAQAPCPMLPQPTNKSVSQISNENPIVVAQAPWPVLHKPTEVTAQAPWPMLWLTQNPYLHNQQLSYNFLTDFHTNKLFLCT
jgi:hypothetical protein